MEIKKMLLTPNKYSRPVIPLKKVTKIAVHYNGGAGATAQNVRDYFESLKDQIPDSTGKYWLNKDGTYRTWKGEKIAIRWVSSHLVVGLGGEIIQCIPFDEYSYCTNQANSYSISIECCHPDTTGKFTEATEKSLAELCAYLCEQFGLDPEKVEFDTIATRQAAVLTAEPPEAIPVKPIIPTATDPNGKLKEITDRLEQGIADLRGKDPVQRAEAVIENCAHPDYKQLLWDYVKMGKGGQTPHTLNAALAFHTEFAASGDMRNTDWSKFA